MYYNIFTINRNTNSVEVLVFDQHNELKFQFNDLMEFNQWYLENINLFNE
jgi:hypothetical protein